MSNVPHSVIKSSEFESFLAFSFESVLSTPGKPEISSIEQQKNGLRSRDLKAKS